ncbi:MAG TPA: tRNA (adenosine(37)-N6)-threonylcarbamoyltransferase complex transferase subunit TsaD [Acidobacteriota bacterium]|nr:tRNA (adenosine(37)-N6)-threonylcarbamoyltransferase complex transferase subunit TsaD [Acidobacteriota bacterium]
MIVLGLESSCDETAAALLQEGTRILSSAVASQIDVHHHYGGVVPELASREHVDNIVVVVQECFRQAAREGRPLGFQDLDGIAVTRGPGLMGALLVGLAYAKGLAYALDIPLLGVNHLQGHLASIFLEHPKAELPALALVVSGGHTNLYYLKEGGGEEAREGGQAAGFQSELLIRTLDDAAGEALDKLSKLLGLGYPGGPVIERLAGRGNPQAVRFTLPKIGDGSHSFSFSGLKTAALRHVKRQKLTPLTADQADDPEKLPKSVLDLAASFQKAVVDQLLDRLQHFLSGRRVRSVHISGGVSCNSELRRRARSLFQQRGLPVYFPSPPLTTDNAAMIAAAGYRRLAAGQRDDWNLKANPSLRL